MAREWVRRSVITATAFGVGAFTLSSPAWGFFPPVTAGDGRVSVLKPPVVTPIPDVIPPVTPPVVPPVVPPCTCTDPEGPQAQGAPEPATLVSAGLGLAALAASRFRKRKA